MKQQSLKIFLKEETGPYELPKGWRWVRLGEVLNRTPQYGLTAKASKETLNIRYLRISDITDQGNLKNNDPRFLDLNEQEFNKYRLYEGDILIARSGSVGRVYLHHDYKQKVVFASYLIRFKLDTNQIIPKFFFYYGLSPLYKKYIEDTLKIVAQPNINAKEYSNLQIPLPPLPEQKRIVARIEALFSKIDEIKRLRKEANDLAKTLMPSALHEVFSKADEKGWKWVRLGEILDLSNGKSITKKEMKEDGAYLVYGSNGVIGKANKYLINKDTIVIGRVGACGVVNIAKAPAWISDNAMYVSKLSDDIDILFLYYALTHLDLSRLAKIVAQPSISQEPIKEQKIPIPFKNRQPALDEQKRIVSYLDQISEKQKTLLKIYADIDNQITQLKQSILTKAFRGQLGKQNFNNDL